MPEPDVKLTTADLTDLQVRCLEGFWNRRPAKQIAADIGISEAWVNKNLMAARRKLHVNSSADAAAIVFGSKPASIKSYYYQETDLPEIHGATDEAIAGANEPLVLATGERPLINSFGPLSTVFGIVLVALFSIVGVTLMIDAGDGLFAILKRLGY